jgi:hypothetical protein
LNGLILFKGDKIPTSLWKRLKRTTDEEVSFDELYDSKNADVLVLFAEPRVMSIDFREILTEFRKIPQSNLGKSIFVSLVLLRQLRHSVRIVLVPSYCNQLHPLLDSYRKKLCMSFMACPLN